MSRRHRSGPLALLFGGSVGFAACSLNSELPSRGGSAAPAGSGVTFSGGGSTQGDAVKRGSASRITDISDGIPNDASGAPGGPDSGGAFFAEGAGGISGAASVRGGTTGTGGHIGGAQPFGPSESGSAGSGGDTRSNDSLPALFFSEYVEGTSSNKALEIAAQARSNLDGCKVGTYFNGKTEMTVVASLSGVLEAGAVLTLCTSTLEGQLGSVCDQIGNLTFNGDDAVVLGCNGELIDVIGQIGVDPGTEWGSSTNSTADHTLRRKCGVTSGDRANETGFEPSAEWQSFPVDTFSGLGERGC